MSKIIAAAGIRGAYSFVAQAKQKLATALKKHGPDKEVSFPNTGYY
jgi:acetyl-CoA synthase